jgi:hypothetical protein
MQDLQELVREIGLQQIENKFYRVCYNLLKQLQDTVARSVEDLLHIHQNGSYNTPQDFRSVGKLAEDLKMAIEEFRAQEQRAERELEDLRPRVRQSLSPLDHEMEIDFMQDGLAME